MPGIMDFVQMAAQNLGQSEESTQSATAALLKGIGQKANGADFEQLLAAIPGAAGLAKPATAPAGAAGGGMLSGLMGGASSMLGGDVGSTLGLLADIQKSGFGMDKAGDLVSLFLRFAKSNAGEALVGRLLGQVPELAKLAG